ncbi:MAG: Rpn family recombination-promoting nuclease/putative transposase [Acidobacteria bacterium]|nr:Rpn family recombination-promoting nuclease/putative transposase [Acidobacteriota bacterium]
MHDPAYKLLFSRPRMVRDLLDGFAARGWSGALDFDTLAPLPNSFVSEDLRQRHGDLVWRVRFRDDRWLYLVLLLEFQATVDQTMALRMLTYTALLYQRLDADGVLRDHRTLPPVLPVVLYNGRRPWTAPVEMTDLVAVGSDLLAPYQPSQRYYLLDGARVADADLPADNLVAALVDLEQARDAARLVEALRALTGLLQAQGDDHLTQAFVTWLHQGLRVAGRLPAGEGHPLTQLQETRRCWKRTCGNGPVNGLSRASSRAAPRASSWSATKSGRCSAVRRRGSSMSAPPRDWPPPSPT